jgi:Ca-activated chloride channel homolog
MTPQASRRKVNLNVQTNRTLIRSGGNSRRYALVTFSAPDAGRASTRHPVNVAFILDRSGSMGGSKISLAKQALGQALRLLRPSDRFAVVFYDHMVDLVVPSTLATREAIENAIRQVEEIKARGNTDLGGGWLRGCEQIAQHLDQSQIGKCLLLTDGLANQGITDSNELERHARELRARGVATSTLGLGHDFNEDLLQRLADAGGGRSYYIETAVQISDTLMSELGETLETVARNAALRVKAGDGVEVTTLNAFECRRLDEQMLEIRLGDLVSRQAVSLVVQLTFPAGVIGAASLATFSLFDEAGALASGNTDCTWTYASHADNDRQPRNASVDREVARLYAGKAREEALTLNRVDRFEEAQKRLSITADRIRQYAGDDSVLNEIIGELEGRYAVYSRKLGAFAAKNERYEAYYRSRMRGPDGRARRHEP